MKPIPSNWTLIEEFEGSYVFENSDHSFNVFIDYDEKLKSPYLIGYEQLEGDYELIEFEEGTFTTTSHSQSDSLEKAILLMNFINEKLSGGEDVEKD